ncbi:MAG: aminotransferase class IV [Verrucomicrobiota bacterium]
MTYVYLNRAVIPEAEAKVSVLDRGFLYGDGLFETLRICHGQLFRWSMHWRRLQVGAEFFGIRLPVSEAELHAAALQLIQSNAHSEGVLRLQISRGAGQRGYSPRGADCPTLVMTTHPLPPLTEHIAPWTLRTSPYRLPAGDPLAAHKSTNKLLQILARKEAEEQGADEALLLNSEGQVAETTSGNLFCVRDGGLITPPASAGILPGITRAVVMELAVSHGIPARESSLSQDDLLHADGLFLTLSSYGLIPIRGLDGAALRQTPLITTLRHAYAEQVQKECLGGDNAAER